MHAAQVLRDRLAFAVERLGEMAAAVAGVNEAAAAVAAAGDVAAAADGGEEEVLVAIKVLPGWAVPYCLLTGQLPADWHDL